MKLKCNESQKYRKKPRLFYLFFPLPSSREDVANFKEFNFLSIKSHQFGIACVFIGSWNMVPSSLSESP